MARCIAVCTGLAAVFAGLVGCAAQAPTNNFAVAAGGYNATFDAAREVLRDNRFRLARVDASAGVLSTEEKPTAGLATPWDLEQSTAHQELDDFLNQQRRTVRVTFEKEGGGTPEENAAAVGSVWVTVYRVQTAGLRVASKASGLTSLTRDPVLEARGTGAVYEVPVMRDPDLERRIVSQIVERTKQPNTTAAGGDATKKE